MAVSPSLTELSDSSFYLSGRHHVDIGSSSRASPSLFSVVIVVKIILEGLHLQVQLITGTAGELYTEEGRFQMIQFK